MKAFIVILVLIGTESIISAQSTYNRVHDIFQTYCTVGCHSGSNPSAQLDLSGTEAAVHANLIEIDPINPAALAKGNKLIDPGYPGRSFLMRKISNGLMIPSEEIEVAEGATMPISQTMLNEEIELVRQWILFGARDTGTSIDEQMLVDYYNGLGLSRKTPPDPPDAGDGVQVHIGPIFVPAGGEVEYFKKHLVTFTDSVEVSRIDNHLEDATSHHFALYKYFDGIDTIPAFYDGLREVETLLDASAVFFYSDIIAQWAFSHDMVMPDGTAFFWPPLVNLDFDNHLVNYDQDSIAAYDFYMNIYTQPIQTTTNEMLSAPIYYGGENVQDLLILSGGQDSTYVMENYYPGSGETWNIWSLQAHTHQLGKGYNIWMRNPDGSKGQQVYNGNYSSDCNFNQGYFDWQHPPLCENDPMLNVNMENGLIHEATFNNPGTSNVGFGLTAETEMFVTYIHYTLGWPLSTQDIQDDKLHFSVYPHPV